MKTLIRKILKFFGLTFISDIDVALNLKQKEDLKRSDSIVLSIMAGLSIYLILFSIL